MTQHLTATTGSVTKVSALTTRRSLIVAPQTSRIEHTELREPAAGEILVQVLMNGLCASDLPTWLQGPQDGPPVALGHEPVARVVHVGPGVDVIEVGDLVTGRLVESFADLALAPARNAVKVPPGLSYEAAIGEPLGCAVEALRRAQVDTGDHVAVVGLGFMGLVLLQLLATRDIRGLVAIDTREMTRRTALAHGAGSYLPAEIVDQAGMRDCFDVVFEVTGAQAGLDLATTLVKPHGTLNIVGYHQSRRTIDMQAWNWKALEVVNGHVRDQRRLTDSIRRGLDVIASGRIDYQSLFTHRYALTEIDRAYTDLRAKPEGFIKAVIVFRDE